MAVPKPLTKKQPRKKNLHEKLWKIFSEYIRRRDNGICFTCNKYSWNEDLGENDWKQMDAGHFRHRKLDFDEMNINCQCSRCNRFMHGNGPEYSRRLIRKYGPEQFEELCQRADREITTIRKPDWYEDMIKIYKQKINDLH